MRRSRRRRRDQPRQVEACQFAPKAQEVRERRLCKCLSLLEFFRVNVSICRKNTITPHPDSVAYVDSMNDAPLLSVARRAVAVNPDLRLAALAAERGWTVLRWR